MPQAAVSSGLIPWRSATIVNSLRGTPVYDTGPVSAAIDWDGTGDEPPRTPDETVFDDPDARPAFPQGAVR